MSKLINCVVDTQNKEERSKLIDFVSERIKAMAVIGDTEGFQLLVVHGDIVGSIGVIVANDLVTKKGYVHFQSFDEFEKYHIKKEIGATRYEIYEKYGLKPKLTHKTGSGVIVSSKRKKC